MKNRLKELREKSKLTQRKVAEMLDVDAKTLYKYENSIVPIPSNKLIELSRIFDVSIDYLVGVTDFQN